MRKKIISFCKETISKVYPSINNDEMEVIIYGLESIYLTVSKLIIILLLSLILSITKEVLILLIFYNIIRCTGFGLHASKSSYCLIFSISFLIGGVYICEYIHIGLHIKTIICLICIISIYKYAPADTHKRPLINAKKRTIYKIITLINASLFTILIVILNENILSNYLLFSLVVAVIVILPYTYKLFKLPYENYKTYNYGLSN